MNHADSSLFQSCKPQAWPGHGFMSQAGAIENTALHNSAAASTMSQQKDALQQHHVDLLQRLQHQYASLDQEKEDRRQAALGALVAGVAHQLNTPVGTSLTVASSLEHRLNEFTKLLESGLRRSDVQHFIEDTRLAVDLLLRNLDRAGALVAGYKQIMATKADAIRGEFKLAALVHETLDSMRDLVTGTAIHAAVDIDKTLVLDSYPQSVREVLIHLIDNALVHGFHGARKGMIWIRARPDLDDGVRIEVEDNGQGIAEKDLPRVFEPFFTTRMAKGSSGLGLHMVHNRVTGLLGGALHIESKPSQYTRVCIHLPKTSFLSDSY